MDDLIDEVCSPSDIKVFEEKYNLELINNGEVTRNTQFEYACFLVRSKYTGDINKGIFLLEELYTKQSGTGKRDYIYYLAIGHARLKNYTDALKCIDGLLKVEPRNRQALDLKATINKRLGREAVKGAAIAGGVLVGLGAIIGTAIALSKK